MSNCDRIHSVLKEISMEQTQGASWSMLHTIRGIIEEIENGANICSCNNLPQKIIEANPTMTPLHWIAYVIGESCRKETEPASVKDKLLSLLEYRKQAGELLNENLRNLLLGKKAIITFSYSSTIEQALLSLPTSMRPKVIVPTSLPGGEGIVFAESLSRAGFQIDPIPDTMIHVKLEQADLAVVGADTVTLDGCLYNKLGTRLLALASKDTETPFYSAFDATKINPFKTCNEIPVLIRYTSLDGYRVSYPVFDSTPIEYLDGIITEKGSLEANRHSLSMLYRELVEILSL
ncbi:MAG: hypothetical protein GSR77_04870 [Desulfurococcales archaeon]|nr:hypothetical protein [Desulfurococcales archaeon]